MALPKAVVHDDQLDLHLFGQDVLDVDADRLSGAEVRAALGKAREVGRDLDEGAIILHAPHDAYHGLTDRKSGGVLGPCAQQFPDGQNEPALYVPALDGAEDLLPDADPVGGGRDAADRHAVDGQQSADAASHVAEGPEGFDVGHGAGEDIAGLERVEVIGLAHPLCFGAGEAVDRLTGLVGVHPLDDKAGGPPDPRQDRNVPHAAGLGSVGTLFKGHHGPQPAKLKPQLAGGIERQCRALQNFAAGHRRP